MHNNTLRKILVAIDLSQSSLNALDLGVNMALRNKASLVLAYVDDQLFSNDSHDLASASNADNTEDILQALCVNLTKKHNINASVLILKGFVSDSIIRASNEGLADLIIMGTHGASGYRQFFIGSNTYTVIKNALCPVLTAPSLKKWTEFRKIVFPVRPIPGALQRYQFLQNLISRTDPLLEVLGLSVNKGEDDAQILTEMVEELRQQVKSDGVKFFISINYGNNIAEDIIKKCAQTEADLLVLSSSVDISRNQFFVGPHSQQVINHSQIPVLNMRRNNTGRIAGEGADMKKAISPEIQKSGSA